MFWLVSCSGRDLSKLPNDEVVDAAARNLKEQILQNYKVPSKKVIAIASFARMDLIKPDAAYSSIIPKLGLILANSLQNEMFEPSRFDLVERLRIDSILTEISLYQTGITSVENLQGPALQGVDYILLGTLQKRETSIRIDARLVSIQTGTVVSVGTTTIPLTSYIEDLYSDYPDRITEHKAKIFAYRDWQTIPVDVKGPAEIEVTAEGSWSITSDGAEFEASGLVSNPSVWGDYRLFKVFNHGQLLCRLSAEPDTIFSLGTFQIMGSGIIECIINDYDRSNNVGAQIVTIRIKPIDKRVNSDIGNFPETPN